MKSLIQTNFLTAPEKVLEELVHSREYGNVIGICAQPLGQRMYLTAVEEIKEAMNDKLIVLKEFDLRGRFIEDNRLFLSQIQKIRSFKARYKDRLMITVQNNSVSPEEEQLIKIRKREQIISFEELKEILIHNINSGNRIKIQLNYEASPIYYYIRGFLDDDFHIVLVSEEIDAYTKNLFVSNIKTIEFDSFFLHKGLSSKIFEVL